MPTKYCYSSRWLAQPGRLSKLTNVQKQPGPTRDYGSSNARSNAIRRRVMRPSTTPSTTQTKGYGPLFGTTKNNSFSKCASDKKNFYQSNSGTGNDVVYWKRIAVGPRELKPSNCDGVNSNCDSVAAAECDKVKNGPC